MMKRAVFAPVLLALVSACASPTADLPLFQNYSTAQIGGYPLGAGDKIRIVVGGFEEMSNEYNISDLGTISVPMIGVVEASGKSTGQIEQEIQGMLVSRELAVAPTVTVQVQEYRPFFILGQVNRPGSYPFAPGMTVLNAISVAGGHTFRADTKSYGITRTRDGEVVEGKGVDNTTIMPGDTIIVHEAWF